VLQPETFRLAKAGARRTEYEDAVACSPRRGRCAVADGASATAFARLWAHLLVHAYTAGWLAAETLEAGLAPIQARWATLVDRRPLAWYAAEQARRGAFAALVGLSLAQDGGWSALAVGDCCLFQVRDDALLRAFPLGHPDAFDARPLLLCSRPAGNVDLRRCDALATATGTWRAGDTFLLMSDALAAAFLRLQLHEATETEPSASPLDVLRFDRTRAGFRRWVESLRARRVLRNDDVSLVWLRVNVDAAP
jgi:Protein phosphatase 2C